MGYSAQIYGKIILDEKMMGSIQDAKKKSEEIYQDFNLTDFILKKSKQWLASQGVSVEMWIIEDFEIELLSGDSISFDSGELKIQYGGLEILLLFLASQNCHGKAKFIGEEGEIICFAVEGGIVKQKLFDEDNNPIKDKEDVLNLRDVLQDIEDLD